MRLNPPIARSAIVRIAQRFAPLHLGRDHWRLMLTTLHIQRHQGWHDSFLAGIGNRDMQ